MRARGFKIFFLLVGDIVIFYTSLIISLGIRRGPEFSSELIQQHLFPFSLVLLLWLLVFYAAGLYDVRLSERSFNLSNLIVKTSIISGLLAAAFFYFTSAAFFNIKPLTILFLHLFIFTTSYLLWRYLFTIFLSREGLAQTVLFIGGQTLRDELVAEISAKPQLGLRTAGIMEENSPILENSSLKNYCLENKVETIVITPQLLQDQRIVKALYECVPLQIRFTDLASFYEEIVHKIPIDAIGQMWFLEKVGVYRRRFYDLGKRIVDIFLSISIGLPSLVILPILALFIRLESKGPIIFKQTRIGENGKVITIHKLRTMVADAEKEGKAVWSQAGDKRITKIGSFLRKTRLDELPQLWDIFKGDLSFVGPRPERPEFVEELKQKIPFYGERHLVKPGLTGWAQISLAYDASESYSREKLQYDLFYVKNRSALLDLGIILRTAKSVLSRAGR